MGKQKFKVGEYAYTMQKIKTDILLPNEKIFGPEPDRDFLQTIQEHGIVYPIIMTLFEGDLNLIDGGRRIKAARKLEIPEMVCQVFEGVSPFDRAAWSIILNQQRSLNPIAEYRYMKQLKEDDVERFMDTVRTDQAHVKKIMSLDSLEEEIREDFISSYEDGKIAEGTLFDIAKMGPARQAYIKTVLESKGKVTGKDIRESKQARTTAVLEANKQVFHAVEVPEDFEPVQEVFVIARGTTILTEVYTDFHSAHQHKLDMSNNGWKVYRLVEV